MPFISVEVDVDLDEFNDEELIDELENRGFSIEKDWAGKIELHRIEHLMDCGQIELARKELLEMVSAAMGRSLQ
jgi:hypothetical protein